MIRSSSQKFVARNRPPRVQIEYDVKVDDNVKRISLPFVVGVIADLSGNSTSVPSILQERQMKEIDIDNFNDRMRELAPRLVFTVPNTFEDKADMPIDITFTSMEDFSPASIAKKLPGLDKLLEQRTQLANFAVYMDGKYGANSIVGSILKDESLLRDIASNDQGSSIFGDENVFDQERCPLSENHELSTDSFSVLLKKEFKPKSDQALKQIKGTLKTLAEIVLSNFGSYPLEAEAAIDSIICHVDQKLTKQINLILHHPEFQQLEGAWRGLHYLVENTETDEMLKIRFMSLSKKNLNKTIQKYKGSFLDQSPLWKIIYEVEYGSFGGEPYGCLIGDYEFGNSPKDVEILGGLAQIAASAHAPFIAAVSPSVMQMENWQEIANPRDITKLFMTPNYAAWRSLRESEDSRYLGLTMPRFLARLPYGNDTDPIEEFNFQEDIVGTDSSYYTWCSSAYLMGVNITRSFKLFGWCSRIRGLESGGAIDGLPTYTFPTDDGGVDMKCPTEISISDRWEAELARNGFMPLVHRKNSEYATFIEAQSFHKPEEYDDTDAATAARLAARLPYLLTCCRFSQYLRCIVRDHIGFFRNRIEMEKYLNDWIRQYVNFDPANSSETSKASKPLADAQIVLDDIEGDPNYYTAKFYLRPHYQLEGLPLSLRLITKMPTVQGRIANVISNSD